MRNFAPLAKALRVFLGRQGTSEPDIAVLALGRVTADGFVDTPPRVTGSVPLTGTSLTFNTTGSDELLRAVPAGTIAALTITFPTDALSRIGQTIGIVSTQTVTTLTVSSSGLTLNGVAITALVANTPIYWIKTAASTWQRTNVSDGATYGSITTTADLTLPTTLDTLATNAGSNPTNAAAFNIAFFAGSGLTVGAKTTPSLTISASQTNTGFLQVLGKTSGGLKLTTADAAAQTVTVSLAAQTSGAATLTIPDQAGVNSKVSSCSTATLTAGATPAFVPGAAISTYLLTPGEDETIAATTTGAVAGKTYHIRVLTSGSSSFTLTFGSNFKSTGTLATGVTTAKTFVVSFLFDGTAFVEIGRTVAM